MKLLTRAAWLDDTHLRPICGRGLVKGISNPERNRQWTHWLAGAGPALGHFIFGEKIRMLVCSKCKTEPSMKQDKGGWCQPCHNEYLREYRKRKYVKDQEYKYKKEYAKRPAVKDRRNKYRAEWRAANPELARAQNKRRKPRTKAWKK